MCLLKSPLLTISRIHRQADGTFKDDDLANILQNAYVSFWSLEPSMSQHIFVERNTRPPLSVQGARQVCEILETHFAILMNPASMRLHEIMGIEQNRKWGVCSLNDFRAVSHFHTVSAELTLFVFTSIWVLNVRSSVHILILSV